MSEHMDPLPHTSATEDTSEDRYENDLYKRTKKTKHEILRFKVRDTLYIIESPNLFLIAAIAFLAGGVLLTLIDILYAIGGRWWNSLTIL